jgi:hypothetical protein
MRASSHYLSIHCLLLLVRRFHQYCFFLLNYHLFIRRNHRLFLFVSITKFVISVSFIIISPSFISHLPKPLYFSATSARRCAGIPRLTAPSVASKKCQPVFCAVRIVQFTAMASDQEACMDDV